MPGPLHIDDPRRGLTGPPGFHPSARRAGTAASTYGTTTSCGVSAAIPLRHARWLAAATSPLRGFLEVLWPRACAGCDAVGAERVCASCLEEVRVRPFRAGDEAGVPVRGHALAGYDSGIGRALLRAKCGGDRSLMRTLAGLLAAHAVGAAASADVIVPAPSAWDRRARRGFAPAALLAHAVGEASGLPVVHALTVTRGSRQAGLDASGRLGNLRGRVRSVAPVRGSVLLVDDVVTTGTTLGTCASELLGDHTDRVTALVLCAAELSRPGQRRPDSETPARHP